MLILNEKQKKRVIKFCDWVKSENENKDTLMRYYAYIQYDYSDIDYAYTLYFDDESGNPHELEHFTDISFLWTKEEQKTLINEWIAHYENQLFEPLDILYFSSKGMVYFDYDKDDYIFMSRKDMLYSAVEWKKMQEENEEMEV